MSERELSVFVGSHPCFYAMPLSDREVARADVAGLVEVQYRWTFHGALGVSSGVKTLYLQRREHLALLLADWNRVGGVRVDGCPWWTFEEAL